MLVEEKVEFTLTFYLNESEEVQLGFTMFQNLHIFITFAKFVSWKMEEKKLTSKFSRFRKAVISKDLPESNFCYNIFRNQILNLCVIKLFTHQGRVAEWVKAMHSKRFQFKLHSVLGLVQEPTLRVS